MTSGLPEPARPDPFRTSVDGDAEFVEVGEFRQGSPFSQWALARYLVGRAVTESIGRTLLIVGVVLLVLAAVSEWALDSTLLAVLLIVVAVLVLLFRAAALTIIRRLTSFTAYAPIEERMRALVDDTSSDVLAELRRVGLPGRLWTLPLLAFRLLGRDRRRTTLGRLRTFELERAVPKARLDELHLLLRRAAGGDVAP